MFGSINYAPESGEGSGGGGDGGDGPKPISEEDVGRIVNSAVTSQLKRLVPTALTEAMAGLDDKITAAVTAVAPKPQTKQLDDGDDAKSGSRITTKELEQQLKALQQQLDASEKAREHADRTRLELEQQSRADAARMQFRDLLQPKVNADLLSVAVDHFSRSRLKVGEDGTTTLTIQRAPYKGAPLQDKDLPLHEALPVFLASDEIKPFLPAPGGAQENGKLTRRSVPRKSIGGVSNDDPAAATVDALEAAGLSLGDLPI